MRFLILTQYYAPEIGAPQVRLVAFTKELSRQGHQVEVVTMMPNYPTGVIFPGYRDRLYLKEWIDGIPVHRVWGYPSTGKGFNRLLNYGSFAMSALIGLARAAPADYLFVESPPLSLALTAYLCASLRGMKIIFNVADLWPDSLKELGFIKDGIVLRLLERLERWAYRKSWYVNAVTRGLERCLILDKCVPANKVLFLPNGVDTSMFRPLPYDHALARSLGIGDKKVLLYTGTHGYVHRIDVALNAANLLRDRGILFIFVGNGSDKERLQDLAKQMSLENVRFLEAVPADQIAAYYSIATAGLSTIGSAPLFDNTRPVKVFTVMACARPVLYSGRGEGADLLTAAAAGIVVPPENPVALAAAIEKLLADPAAAAAMGRSGRTYAEQHLGWGVIINQWLQDLQGRDAAVGCPAGPVRAD